MAGSKTGGLKAAKAMKRKYGRDYYRRIGEMGGKVSSDGGFYHMSQTDPDRHKDLSAKGGQISRRGPEGVQA